MPGTTSILGLVELADSDGLVDTYGADCFKDLRAAFYQRLKSWIRENDSWRELGNNRVCVILKNLNGRAELELATAKLSRIFEDPHHLFNQCVSLGVNAGFVTLDDASNDINIALRQAGTALREAKKSNRFFEVYTPRFERSAVDERALVKKLEVAVERGELELYYQPKLHAGYRTVIGAEALMRWHTADKKVITPDQFIGVAERHAVIKPMTWWAIKSAVARLARWPEDMSIAVNITPTLLLDDEILTVVKDVLEIHMVKPQRLILEVLESIMVDNQQPMLRQLARLRKLGVKVSIDDFGTGFSSLSYFRDLPADEIKIDKSFVMPMLSSGKDHAIVKAVIDLAHNFSLRVVAEGVEDQKIAKRLTELNCDVLQGHVFDRPLPVADFERRYVLGQTGRIAR
jgi:EAL domain-containing protein (putative c-di-GMP-specific phosphodiesterase class I)/GGDEF domain-containing protein